MMTNDDSDHRRAIHPRNPGYAREVRWVAARTSMARPSSWSWLVARSAGASGAKALSGTVDYTTTALRDCPGHQFAVVSTVPTVSGCLSLTP
jgi:hypothetical protein